MAGLHTGDELEEWQIHDLQTKSDTRKAVDKAMDSAGPAGPCSRGALSKALPQL